MHGYAGNEETLALAERIRQAIGNTPFALANDAPAVTASVGAMAASSAHWSIKVAAADRAMIEVKNSGRNSSKLGRLVTG
ncbi:MAG: diguanylate cyclase [Ahniella sp.]|nr:diguanylate cyclase [Ahniella sp.]